MEGKPTKPYKPYITSPRRRGGRSGFRPRGGCSSSDCVEGWPRSKGRLRGGRGGFSQRGRFQGRKFDKSPTTKRPQVSSKAEDKDKDRCYHCHQRGHFVAKCPKKNKGQPQKSSEGKKFEDYTYAYGGAEEPQLAMATALSQAYEEALSAMQQSVFMENLRYMVPETPAPGFDIQGQGCIDFSPERVNRMDQARDISMAPLEFQHMPASEYLDRYDGITPELNVNMEYDDAVDVTTTFLGHESIKLLTLSDPNKLSQYTQIAIHGGSS